MENLVTKMTEGSALEGLNPLASVSTDELRQALATAFEMTVKHLRFLAAVWTELERRGEDLSDLRAGITKYLPWIAIGKISPTAVIRHAGQEMLLSSLAETPMQYQEALLDGTMPVKVLEYNPEGELVENAIPLAEMKASQIRLAFGKHGMRTVAEQRELREREALRTGKRKELNYRMRIDRETEILHIGRRQIKHASGPVTAKDLLLLLGKYYDRDFFALGKLLPDENQKNGVS